VALRQSQMTAAVADRAEMSRADASRALTALDEIVLEELGNAQKVRIGGLVQLTVRVKPATKKCPFEPVASARTMRRVFGVWARRGWWGTG
jgi:nucleoid DNA-binding protein